MQREQLEADVLIVGAGPAGLSCALHLANLIKKHNASGRKPELSTEMSYDPACTAAKLNRPSLLAVVV